MCYSDLVAGLAGATDRAEALQTELKQLRTASSGLAKDYANLKESVRQAKNESVATAETVKDIDTKLGHFKELHELSKTTEERIGALNALADRSYVSENAYVMQAVCTPARATPVSNSSGNCTTPP